MSLHNNSKKKICQKRRKKKWFQCFIHPFTLLIFIKHLNIDTHTFVLQHQWLTSDLFPLNSCVFVCVNIKNKTNDKPSRIEKQWLCYTLLRICSMAGNLNLRRKKSQFYINIPGFFYSSAKQKI